MGIFWRRRDMNKILIEMPEREKGVNDIIEIMIEYFHDCAQKIFDYFKIQEIK
jgi:hypothetical protein